MEPQPLGSETHGNVIKVEVSDYNGIRYAHIRKFFQGRRTRYGVALVTSEVKALVKAFSKQKTFPPPKAVWKLSDVAHVNFGKSVTFSKRSSEVYLTRDQFENIRKILSKVKEAMFSPVPVATADPPKVGYCPKCRCVMCRPLKKVGVGLTETDESKHGKEDSFEKGAMTQMDQRPDSDDDDDDDADDDEE